MLAARSWTVWKGELVGFGHVWRSFLGKICGGMSRGNIFFDLIADWMEIGQNLNLHQILALPIPKRTATLRHDQIYEEKHLAFEGPNCADGFCSQTCTFPSPTSRIGGVGEGDQIGLEDVSGSG
jgi:hypothetical protein